MYQFAIFIFKKTIKKTILTTSFEKNLTIAKGGNTKQQDFWIIIIFLDSLRRGGVTLCPEASGRKHIFISQKHMLPARLTAVWRSISDIGDSLSIEYKIFEM